MIGVISFVLRQTIRCQAPTLLHVLLYFSPAPVSPPFTGKGVNFQVRCFQSMGVGTGKWRWPVGGNGLNTLINTEQVAWPPESDDTLTWGY